MKKIRLIFGIICTTIICSCSVTKFVPNDEYLLSKVDVKSSNKDLNTSNLKSYVRQNANARWFSTVKIPLYIYNMSGRDSTRWNNRLLRRIGEAPVLYSESQADKSCSDLKQALQNIGYMGAYVDLSKKTNGKKMTLTYNLHPGVPYHIKDYKEQIDDEGIDSLLQNWTSKTQPKVGKVLNINELNQERQSITNFLQNQGYYKFNKEYITYVADTVRNTHDVNLTMHLLQPEDTLGNKLKHQQYYIDKINFVTDFNFQRENRAAHVDSLQKHDMMFYFTKKPSIRPKVMIDNNRIGHGELYNEDKVQITYNNFGRLRALKYTNINFVEKNERDSCKLDCYILTSPSKSQSFTAELEGTNTAGDLGAAATVGYQHKNIFRGSELFSFKVRGAYEAITGLEGYSDSDYKEWGAEASISFPRFKFPFLSRGFKRSVQATSEVKLQLNSQIRPEYSRQVASAGWSYKWNDRHQKYQHRVDVVDINYIYMPRISQKFKEEYLDSITKQNAILKYNYENLLIMKMGYNLYYNSEGYNNINQHRSNYSIRLNVESAGNLLYGISKAFHGQMNSDGQYTVANIAYAQYVKGDFDFVKNFVIDNRNTIVAHLGFGMAYPYGNSTILPFEKRYFSGGSNSVRGWGVRTLGPGSYQANDANIDFINQSGDVKLDINLEYRTHLGWILDGAIFADAGNIWTLRNYVDQPGGQFKLDQFYKQIAMSYGIGLRLNFNYLVVRFDGGMKAVNPAYESGKGRYPIFHPRFSRDFAFHFAVGYPF